MTGDIIGVSFVDGRPGVALFDGASPDAKGQVMLLRQFPGESVRLVSGTRDGRLSVVSVYAGADPGMACCWQTQHGSTLPECPPSSPFSSPRATERCSGAT